MFWLSLITAHSPDADAQYTQEAINAICVLTYCCDEEAVISDLDILLPHVQWQHLHERTFFSSGLEIRRTP